ncbi:MAG: Arylsulfatase [Verrucomicrobia subdivision 3 bacterium]|nr:Arylsulfatase [Limisphaerales bacterium]MCS1413157.1 Arylsulfatase [Limisphaerales bacterium]
MIRLTKVALALLLFGTNVLTQAAPLNLLFISVDDMSCDSVGVYGCRLNGTTPHIDRLAAGGLRFEYAHVVVGNCMPGRNAMFSGLYPHNNHVEGFYQIKEPEYPVLCDLMKSGGYFTAIRGKVAHSTPYTPYAWDLVLDGKGKNKRHNKDIESYYTSTKEGIAASQKAGKPFCLLINISDPHKPFYGVTSKGVPIDDPYKPSRIFTADEVPVPGFLPDTPKIREELAYYYSSVRRADDAVGKVIQALQESGQIDDTVIMFLSDHGMPLPFVKTAVYHHSTRTPWIIKWPGVTKPNSVDRHHMISAIDLLPTLLDITGIRHPENLDGRSFLPLIRGGRRSGWDMIFKEYNENSGAGRHPMRSVQTKRFSYIFNPWSDGRRKFKTATTSTASYRELKRLAQTDAGIAERLRVFDLRDREEFYDYQNDPDALYNLIDHPDHQAEIERLRDALGHWMMRTGDPLSAVFQMRHNEDVVQRYMARVEHEAQERRRQKRREQKL